MMSFSPPLFTVDSFTIVRFSVFEDFSFSLLQNYSWCTVYNTWWYVDIIPPSCDNRVRLYISTSPHILYAVHTRDINILCHLCHWFLNCASSFAFVIFCWFFLHYPNCIITFSFLTLVFCTCQTKLHPGRRDGPGKDHPVHHIPRRDSSCGH